MSSSNGRFRQIDPNNLPDASPASSGLIGRLIQKGLGTRHLLRQLGGFDTHSGQADMHANAARRTVERRRQLLQLARRGRETRVALMTYSEFGRRVKENGSRGTDHGSGSCMFVAGTKVVGGLVGKHPSLSDLTDGDIKYHTDFRRVYATLLDDWLGVRRARACSTIPSRRWHSST